MGKLRTTSIKPIVEWMSRLKPGDSLWFQPLYGQQPSDAEYRVKKVGPTDSRRIKITIESKKGWGQEKTLDAMSLVGANVWNSKPLNYEE
jgi:hypothetical protein